MNETVDKEGTGSDSIPIPNAPDTIEEQPPNNKLLVMLLTLAFASVGLSIIFSAYIDLQAAIELNREDGMVENFQAVMFLIAGILWFILAWWKRKALEVSRKRLMLYILLGLGMVLFFLEEISWGQRIYGYSTPSTLESVNTQGESNIHNIDFFGTVLPPYELIALAVIIIIAILIFVAWKYKGVGRSMEQIFIPLGQYDLVAPLLLCLAFASYPDMPDSYWLLAIPFLFPIAAMISGKFRDFFQKFQAPQFQFILVAAIAILMLALSYNSSTADNISHNIAFETRETVLVLVLVCYPLFEAGLFRKYLYYVT